MTEAEFLALDDAEKNALVAEHVFGWHRPGQSSDPRMEQFVGFWFNPDGEAAEAHTPDFWTSIADAWQVVEKMRADGWHAVLKSPFQDGSHYVAGFTPNGTTGWNGRPDFMATSPEGPGAPVCLAALRAKGVVT